MSRTLALLVYGTGILILLAIDLRRRKDASHALWIPLLWLLVLASRPLSAWFDSSHGLARSAVVEEGNDTDRNFALLLMLLSIVVLVRRGLDWGRVVRNNGWLLAFLLYCGISVVWSDFALVGAKRWIRALGSVLVILVVLTEDNPIAAIRALVRRCMYILIPVSILLIKYYRELGVDYDFWTGELYIVGASVNKNGLGRLCLISGIFLVADIIATWRIRKTRRGKLFLLMDGSVLVLTLWLLAKSNSATSLVAFVVGSGAMFALGLPIMRRNTRSLGTIVLVTVVLAAVLGMSFQLVETAVEGLGRNMTLTSRTPLWGALLGMETNPLLGVGYDTFWLGHRLDRIIDRFNVNEAHNGYLEVYLELGLIGLTLLLGFVMSVFKRAKQSLRHEATFDYGRLQVAVLAVFLLYNVTESAYKATTLMCFALFLLGMGIPRRSKAPRPSTAANPPRQDPRFGPVPAPGATAGQRSAYPLPK